jgi:hypothetical protein
VSYASHTSALNTAAAIRWFLYRFIFALLFREQVRLAELVDNAFDAGARLVVIEIDPALGPRCAVCRHPRLFEITGALASGMSQRAVARKYHLRSTPGPQG